MPTIAQSAPGRVTALWGSALIRGADGKMHALKVGDLVRTGDVILTTQNGIVQINADEGTPAQASTPTSDEIDRVITGLNEGSPETAPAAGLTAGGDGNLGEGLRVDRITEGLTAGSQLENTRDAHTQSGNDGSDAAVAQEKSAPAPVLGVSSSAISAAEEGTATNLGLTPPTGAQTGASVRVDQVPAIGEIRKADGTLVTAGTTLSPADLAGLSYVPPADYDGAAAVGRFDYTVTSGSESATGGTSVALAAVNDAPLATWGGATGDEDSTIPISLGGTDVDGFIAGVTISSVPAGSVVLLADGVTPVLPGQTLTPGQAASLLFRPAPETHGGSPGITFTVTDNGGLVSAPARFGFFVTAINDAPVARDDSVATVEDTPVTLNLLGNDSDADGDALTIVAIAGQPVAAGSPVLLPQGSVALNGDGTLTFTPNPDFNGTVAFGYTVSDGTTTSTAAVSVTVAAVNDPAVIGGVASGATVEDTTLVAGGTLTIADPDAGEAAFVAQANVAGTHGTFSVDAAGAWTYTLNNADPAVQALGQGQSLPAETFTVASVDGTSRVVTVSVTGTNDAAVITADVGSLTEDSSGASGTLAIGDVDAGQAGFVAQPATAGSYGSFTLAADGSWTYALNNTLPAVQALGAGQTLTETFTVVSLDGTSSSVTVTINGGDDAPVISAGAGAVTENAQPSASGTLIATDVDNPALAFVAGSSGGAYGTLVLAANGAWTYTLDARAESLAQSQVVNDVITVALDDGSTTTVTLAVTGTNDAPVAQAAAVAIAEDAAVLNAAVTATDIDSGAVLSFALNGATPAGLSFNANGSYSFDPSNAAYQSLAAGQSQVITVPYAVTDEHGTTSSANLVITVTGTNDAPVAQAAAFSVAEGAPIVTGNVLATDVDPGAVLTYGLNVPAPAGLSFNPNGSYSFDASASAYNSLGVGQSAVLTVPYTVTDEHGASSTANLVITVTGTNDTPVAGAVLFSVAEDAPVVTGTVPASDPDGGAVLTFALAGPAAAGLVLNTDGSYTFNPADPAYQSLGLGQARVISIPYTVTDEHGAGAIAGFVIVVTGTNDVPVAVADSATVAEDGSVVIEVRANDSDAEGTPLTITQVAGLPISVGGTVALAQGSVVLNADGTLTFTPNADFNGGLDFGYTVSDGLASASAQVHVDVSPVNDAPVAQAAAFAVGEDGPVVSGAVVATDVEAGAVLGFALVGPAPAGLIFNADGSYSFDPSNAAYQSLAAGQVLAITAPFTVTDEAGASSTANLVITVTGVNDAAVVTGVTTGTVAEDGIAVATGTLVATDVDSPASFTAAGTSGTYGDFSIDATGHWSYTLRNGDANVQALTSAQHPTETFTVTTADGTVQLITVTVNGANEAPAATVTPASGFEDAVGIPITLAAGDTDGAIASFTVTALPASGTLLFGGVPVSIGSVIPATAGSAALSFVPDANWNGSTTLSFSGTDGEGAGSAVVSQSISVAAVNDAPTALDDAASTTINTPLASIAVLANDGDVDGDALSVVSAALADGTQGSVSINPDGTLAFTPALNFSGAVLISYAVRDPSGASSVATLTVNVGENTAPTGADTTLTLAEDSARSFSAADFGFADGDAGQTLAGMRIDSLPAAGSLTYNGVPVVAGQLIPAAGLAGLVFTPAANANGAAYASFTFSVQDSAGGFDASPNKITLDVTPVGDPAVIGGVTSGATVEDTTLVAGGTLTIADPDAGEAAFVAQTSVAGAHGTFSIDAAGAWTYTLNNADPAVQALGQGQSLPAESFTVASVDGTTQVVTVTVSGTNDAPVAQAASFAIAEDGSTLNGQVLATDIDNGAVPSFALNGAAPAGLSFNANGSYSFDPSNATYQSLAAGQSQVIDVAYTVTDEHGATSSANLVITVTGTNDVPVAQAAAFAVAEDAPVVNGSVVATDADTGATLSFVLVGAAPAGLSFNADGSYSFDPSNAAYQSLAAGQSQVITVPYRVTDDQGASSVANLVITVTGTNDTPVAQASSFSVAEDAAVVNGSVTATDIDAGTVLGYALTGPAPAGLTFNANGSYSFNAGNAAYQSLGTGQSQVITVPFRVTDDQGASSVANLVITVTGTNDGPVAVADTGALSENATLTTTAATGVLANDTDVDSGDTKAVSAVSFGATTGTVGSGLNGTYGTLTLNADGSYSYSANRPAAEALTAGQVVTESFTYTMRDAAGATSTATITFTITGTNDVPTITGPLTGSATEDTTLTSTGTLVVVDPDAGQSSFVAQAGSAGTYGSFSITTAGAWTYTLNNAAANVQALPAGTSVTDSFTVTTADGTTRTVVVTVTGTNDGPVAVGSSVSVAEDASTINGAVTATDADTGAVLGYALTGAAPAGLTFNANGTYSFNPSHAAYQSLGVGQSQVITVPFRVTDDQGASSVANLVITVTGTNDGPVAVADTGALSENATLTTTAATGVLANDTDVDSGDTKAVSAVSFGATTGTVGSGLNGTYGTLTLNADGSYSYSANRPATDALTAGQIVTENFGYTMRDATGATSTATITFTITGTNDVPTITGPQTGAVTEDTTLSSTGTLTIVDPDAGQSSFVAQTGSAGTYGNFSITAAGAWTYTLNNAAANVQALPAGTSVTDSFTVTTADGATRTIVVTVDGTNDGPVAVGSSVSVAEDAAVLSGSVTATDVDTGAVLGYALTGAAPAGFTFNTDGSYSFNPAHPAYQSLGVGQSQVITVAYEVTDDQGASSTANLVITVTGTNDVPVAVADTGSLAEDATLTTTAATGVLSNDTDADAGDTKAVSAVSFGATTGTVGSGLNGTYGTLTLNADGSYSYSANRPAADALAAGQVVTESFTYTMRDAAGATSTATITFTITGTNDVPTITGPLTGSATEDTTLTSTGTLVVVDPDAGQSSFVAQAGSAGIYGSFSITTAGVWTYTLNNAAANVQALPAGTSVTDSFTVTTADGTTRTVVVTVTGTNDGPVAVGSSVGVAEDAAAINGSVAATDVDTGATLAYTLTGAAPAGLVLNADGSYSFNPSHAAYQSLGVGQSQVITVPFRVTDDQGASSVANLVITVTGTNDGPVAVADTGALSENATLTTTAATGVLANDTDVDSGDTKAVSAVSFGATTGTVGSGLNGTYGTLTLNADGSYSYAANRPAVEALTVGQVVTENFSYTMRDATGATSTATITFTVTGTNDVPTITGPQTGAVTEDTTLSSTGTLTIVDPDAGQSSFVAQSGAAGTYGSFSITAAGAWTYTLNNAAANVQALPAGTSVTDSFTVTTADGATRTIVVTVDGTNDGPVAVGSSVSVAEDAAVLSGSVTATDVDAGTVLGYALTGPAPAGLTFNANGTYSFNPSHAAYQSLGVGQSQVITVPFRATDDQGANSTANLVITVTGTNDGPVAVADSGSVAENASLTTTAATGVLANDTDVDSGDTKAVSAVSFGATSGTVGSALNGTYGTLTLNADGSYSYSANRPAVEALTAGQVVTENFSYTMLDAAGATSTGTITFTITGTNDVPTITGPLSGSVTEDTTLTSSGTLTIADPDAGQSSFLAQSGAAGTYGSFSITAAGAWTYTLNNAAANVQALPAGASGTDSFTVTTSDGTTRTIVVTVNGTNDGPVAVGSSFTVAEDAAVVNGSVTATDADTGAVLSYALTGAAPAGLTFNANGSYSFDAGNPAYQSLGAGQSQVITVPFRATDAQGASSVANLVITVTGTNDGPVAAADTGALNENATLTTTAATGVLANDTDVDSGDTKAVSAVSFGATGGTVGSALNGTYGTLTLNADGSYSYSANRPAVEALTAGQTVTESFSYTMRDTAGATSTATVTFTITGTNDAPTITGPLTGTVREDTTLTSTGTLVISDPDAGQSSFVAHSGAAGTYGSFSITAAGAWTYTLNNAAANVQALGATASVTDSFTVTTADGTTRTIVLTVNGTNDGPVAVADVGTAVEAGGVANATAGTNPSGNVLSNDTDVDSGDTRTVSAVSGTGAGTVGGSTAGAYGTLTLNADGTYSYALNNSLAAVQALRTAANTLTDTFTYTVRDAAGATSSTTLTVTIQGANDAPVAIVDTGALAENATLTATAASGVLANDTDVDAGDSKVVSAVTFGATAGTVGSALNGTYGTLTLNADGSYSYSANRPAAEALTAGQVVTEAFTYTVRDTAGTTASTTLTFTITGANDAPTISGPLTGTVKEDTTLTSTGTLTIVDPDAGQSSFVAQSATAGTYGSFSITTAGAWTYTLNNAATNVQALGATASVTDSFTVVTADGTTRTVVVTVNGSNDAPVAAADSASTNEDTALTINAATLLANDTDRDTGDTLTITSVQGASGGSVALNGAGNVVFTPTANHSGPASFSYTVSDGHGGTSTATVNLTVAAVADAPTLSAPAQVFLLTQGATTGSTTAAITQATIEGALGLPSGRLDNFDPPAGSSTSDPGNVNVVDGKFNSYDLALGASNQVNFNWQFFNGEDTVSEINSGYNDLLVVVVTDPTGAKQYFQVTSSEQLGRNTNGNTVDATGTFTFTATTAGHYQFDWIVGNGLDDGKDSSMSVAAPTVTVGGTTYGAPVFLGISAGLVDTDGSESLGLTVSGVPGGAALSAGTNLGGGVWSLSAAQLDDLSLLPATGYTGTLNLTVTATATEASNGSSAVSSQTIAVTVDATTNAVAGTAAAETLSGTNNDDVVYGYGGNDTINGNNGNDLLYGGAGNDTINAGSGNDVLYGGAGSDALTGGSGADVFAWTLADRGAAGTPPTDTISDFSIALPSAGGDLLDLRDLLQGETRTGGTGNLDNYLDFDTTSSAGNTIIRISSSGGFAGGVYNAGAEDQRIVLTGVDLRSAATFGLNAGATDNQIINELLTRGKLITDGP